ncbi:MAG: hypothetical protein LBL67_03440 [Coriobacteriales bacterium]|jgi:sulfur transfer complex TusBCD TusB component (DsrH family)|nr:hypothetical protein [Coriobacteriales bacterium]
MRFLRSAHKHRISEDDALMVLKEPKVIARLREEPEKLLFLGFDSHARALEVITDSGLDGETYVIHVDKITPIYERLLEEAL